MISKTSEKSAKSPQSQEPASDKWTKEALQVSKEIAIKFIEIQRISPSNFVEIFPGIFRVVIDTIKDGQHE